MIALEALQVAILAAILAILVRGEKRIQPTIAEKKPVMPRKRPESPISRARKWLEGQVNEHENP